MHKQIKAYVDKFNSEHEELYKNSISDSEAFSWIDENVPHLSCPDKTVEETYYFRWWTYRKHIRNTPEGYVITEFLPDVYWSGHYNAIVCPASHQIAEGKWIKNKQYIKDYIKFYLVGSGSEKDVYSYSNWLCDSVYRFCSAQK